MLEVCIDSLESAFNAIHGGADELEVCSSLSEGGLTPSLGLVKEIQVMVANIRSKTLMHKSCVENCYCITLPKAPKVNVMIRSRTGSDFCYNDFEMDTMLSDLDVFKTMNVDRFVFGSLDHDKFINIVQSRKIIEKARPIPVTFHRAFDICRDPLATLEIIIEIGFNRVLTSGQQETAVSEQAISLIKDLIKVSDNRIEIMPGAGVHSNNVTSLIDIGCKIFHSSCKKIRHLNKCVSLSMGIAENEYIFITNEDSVKEMKRMISENVNQ